MLVLGPGGSRDQVRRVCWRSKLFKEGRRHSSSVKPRMEGKGVNWVRLTYYVAPASRWRQGGRGEFLWSGSGPLLEQTGEHMIISLSSSSASSASPLLLLSHQDEVEKLMQAGPACISASTLFFRLVLSTHLQAEPRRGEVMINDND